VDGGCKEIGLGRPRNLSIRAKARTNPPDASGLYVKELRGDGKPPVCAGARLRDLLFLFLQEIYQPKEKAMQKILIWTVAVGSSLLVAIASDAAITSIIAQAVEATKSKQ